MSAFAAGIEGDCACFTSSSEPLDAKWRQAATQPRTNAGRIAPARNARAARAAKAVDIASAGVLLVLMILSPDQLSVH